MALAALCRASLARVQAAADAKSLRLACTLADPAGRIFADPERLGEALGHLLDNAVKFTEAGGRVTLEVTADPAAGMVRLAVQDTGIGIAAEDLPKLFHPFAQLDAGLERRYGGTGLGLALARRLVELHGGRITVESAVGKGSRFTISLCPGSPGT